MTRLEKEVQVKNVLLHMCAYGEGCAECRFFNPDDDTDGDFFCTIRDKDKRLPDDDMWDMASAMLSD